MRIITIAAAGLVAGLAAGCGNTKKAGEAIPADMKPTALADLLAKPKAWAGKQVVLEGAAAWVCGSGCEFTLSDGVRSETVYAEGFKVPAYRKGQKVRVIARIESGKERPVITATGIEAP